MSLPDDFLDIGPGDPGWWRADIKFMDGGAARGSGGDEIEAMEAVRDDIDLILRDIAGKRSMLEDLINRAVRDRERYNASRQGTEQAAKASGREERG